MHSVGSSDVDARMVIAVTVVVLVAWLQTVMIVHVVMMVVVVDRGGSSCGKGGGGGCRQGCWLLVLPLSGLFTTLALPTL